jgi:predicted neuraminidase
MTVVSEARKQFVFDECSRFRSCHAATLMAFPEGGLIAAWFGGTAEGDPDVDIWFARREGGIWSVPERAAGMTGIAHWNPVLFQGDCGEVHLYYKIGPTIPEWVTMRTISRDQGRTWSEPVPLAEGDIGGRGPVRNKPIVLGDGTWLAPASVETAERWDAFTDLSADGGKTWIKSAMVPLDHASLRGKGIIQPTLWESGPNRVHMLLRSTEGYIYRSDSIDNGRTWCAAYPTSLPNNNSGIDLVKLNNNALVLVHNPVMGNWAARTPLVCSVSEDNGLTWEERFVLEDEPGEYSYPAIVAVGNRTCLVYTWRRERIAFWDILWE